MKKVFRIDFSFSRKGENDFGCKTFFEDCIIKLVDKTDIVPDDYRIIPVDDDCVVTTYFLKITFSDKEFDDRVQALIWAKSIKEVMRPFFTGCYDANISVSEPVLKERETTEA